MPRPISDPQTELYGLLHTFGGADLCSAVTLHASAEAAEAAHAALVRERWAANFHETFPDDRTETEAAESDDRYEDAEEYLSNEADERFEIVIVSLPAGLKLAT